MKRSAGLICLLIGMAAIENECGELGFVQRQNVPQWVREAFSEQQLDSKYAFSTRINPFYLRGDFDGDGDPDVAIFVYEKTSQKVGIAIVHHGTRKIHIVGAGTRLGNVRDDFTWLDIWHVFPNGPVSQGVDQGPPPELLAEAIYIEKSESFSAILYWSGQEYQLYGQGD